jgi:GTP-binding protein
MALWSMSVHPNDEFSAAEIEAGRRLFAGEWSFRSAAASLSSLPPMAGPEIAFAGRSNVGKSSLINALTGRRALARTSNTPGRTQELIFFGAAGAAAGAGRLVLVDMPGYGYAGSAHGRGSSTTICAVGPRSPGCTFWSMRGMA